MASDAKWWRHHQPAFAGAKYSLQPGAAPWATVLRHTGPHGVDTDPSALRSGMNSGAAAINLAVHYGAGRVLLLGYDMGPTGGRTHYFGDHPPGLRASSPYQSFIECIETMVAPLSALGVRVINCSRETALRCFDRMTLAEALR